MTPLPPPLGDGSFRAWRLDTERFSGTWDSGQGSRLYGGRWNTPGRRVVYCSADPATAILEVAVHKGFRTLDVVRHVLTSCAIRDPAQVHVVPPGNVPNPSWLRPGLPSVGQQQFGDALLGAHRFVLLPSAVSTHSWNLIFDPAVASEAYELIAREGFELDPRLHPPV